MAGTTSSRESTVANEVTRSGAGPAAERERFVPRRIGQLQEELASEPWDDPRDADRFRAFGRLVVALYHFEFHDREQAAIDAWDDMADNPAAAEAVTNELGGLLDGANYTPITMAELDRALNEESLIPLRLEVDLDDYDEVLMFRRGARSETVTVPKLRGLYSREQTMTVDDRVVIHTRVKPRAWFDQQGIDPADRNLIPGLASLKLFQNVPRADIEMLLPSTEVRFRPIDTVIMGVPALVSGLVVLTTKLLPTIGLIALVVGAWLGLRDEAPDLDQTSLLLLFGGAVTLGGFLFRQWTKFKNRRVEYLKTLSENLYFRTLADGPGVIHTLLSAAEQQEVAEVLLAYRFLLAEPVGGTGTTMAQLDAAVEDWLRRTCHLDIDFEVDDAVAKLRRLDAVEAGVELRARPLPRVLASLDHRWDNLFRHRPQDQTDDRAHGGRMASGHDAATDMEAGPLIRLRGIIDRFTGRLGDRFTASVPGQRAGPAGPPDDGQESSR
jgi:hypothetical protein